MILYFGFKGTIIDHEGNLRRHADFVLKELAREGHRLFLMESEEDCGVREAVEKLELLGFFEGIVPVGGQAPSPDYVIDTNVDRFQGNPPGYQLPYFNYYSMLDDEELLEVYRQIQRIMGASGPPPRTNVNDVASKGQAS
jgi:hypothetical protein